MDIRLTKIICTLGPASGTGEHIAALADAGMNIARINVSHGTRREHTALLETIRIVNAERNVPVATMLDTRGAEIRTGDVQTPLQIRKGDTVLFAPHAQVAHGDERIVTVNYDGFAGDVRETDRILLDNGELSFDILEIRDDGAVQARARESGTIGSRRHINLPGADIDLPSVTENDWDDIGFAAEQGVDFVALSFIRSAEEVEAVRAFLAKRKSSMRIITKVETAQAIEQLQSIVDASDGVMVARGDLGAEVPFERLPALQSEIVVRCSNAGKPVIVATHMLESMKEHPMPTRAEVTDVAHAASESADATMLSGETATGKHPVTALEAMHRILLATERHGARFTRTQSIPLRDDPYDARAQATVQLAHDTDASAILVFTRTGRTAMQISRFRPNVPIIACTHDAAVQRSLALFFGVFALHTPFGEPEETVQSGMRLLQKAGLGESGDRIIVVSDIPKHYADWSIQQRSVA